MPTKNCSACMSNSPLWMCKPVELMTPHHSWLLTWEVILMSDAILYSQNEICTMMYFEPLASHHNRICKAFFEIQNSFVHFTDLVCLLH